MNSTMHATDVLYPSRRSAWFACTVLTVSCVIAMMDRSIISLFIIPIQRDVGLTDTQVSLLVGLAFGLFNALFGFPVARWVDSGRRTLVASVGIFVWSLATIGSGLTLKFTSLFLTRVVMGAGEATLIPPAFRFSPTTFPPHAGGWPSVSFTVGHSWAVQGPFSSAGRCGAPSEIAWSPFRFLVTSIRGRQY